MDIIKQFGKLSKRDTLLAGGKGASLGEMTQAGIPVPEGFVVLSGAFDRFIEETNLVAEIDSILHSVNLKEVHTVEDASEKIHALILDADMPKDIAVEIKKAFKDLDARLVAVRSSATAEDSSTAAWAGQLETYLNTSGKTLLGNVKECWASLFTPRAIVYRIEKKLHKRKISVAVVVQKMVQSEVSGVAFSVHPVTQDKNQIIIEAGFGLGEAVVSGSITPDSYIVEKKELSILSKSVEVQKRMLVRSRKGGNEWQDLPRSKGERQVLADKHILELSKLVAKIERHYGFPVDIEWAHEDGKFYILQSRPITTLIKGAGVQKTGEEPVLQRLKSLSWRHWLDRPYGPFMVTLGYAGVGPKYFSRIGLDGFGYISNLYQYPDIYKSERLAKENTEKFRVYFRKHSIFDLSRLLTKMHSKNVKEIRRIIASKDTPTRKLSRAREKIRLYFPFLWIIDPLEDYYLSKIDSIVPSYIKGDIQKWVGDVSILEKKNAYVLMQDALRKEPVEKVRDKFAWLKSRDGFTDFYTIDELKEIKSQFKGSEKHDVAVPTALKGLAEELKELSFFRADRTDKFYELLGLCRPVFKEVAESLAISFKELAFYDVDSIIAGKPRKISVPFNFLYLDGKQSIRHEKFIEFAKAADEEIKGTAAYIGTVRGTVKIIRHPSELGKIKEGDILVAQMTFPAFISAMNKASAFVTDEGSITCHAAIVSREMKKPCIIGTKTATKLLKDGDFVEVDADNGVVRVLKKAQAGKESAKTLTNIFSREKSLLYFCVWEDGDKNGVKLIDEDLHNDLFIVPPKGKKGEVWYEKEELQRLKDRLREEFRNHKGNRAWDSIVNLSKESWRFLEPYAKGRKSIRSVDEFGTYYGNLVDFWTCLNSIIYEVLDDKEIDPFIKKYLAEFRGKTEKYTEHMSFLQTDYLEKHIKSKELAFFITKDEALEFLHGKKDILSMLKGRLNGCFMLNGVVHPLGELDTTLAKNNLVFEKISSESMEMKGNPAFGGVAQGTAKVINGFSDLDKIKPGDILVTQMTNPKYLPAIRKSSAVVTDEGGMLCHAAITARELKKPCVIGTKIASKIIKDGDIVEVDADKGIVKILESCKGTRTQGQKKVTRFEKAYTRDFSIIMEEAWSHAFEDGLTQRTKWKNPFLPPTAYYINDGVIEVWENNGCIQWLKDKLLSENKNNKKFIPEIITNYQKCIKDLEPFWRKGYVDSKIELRKPIDLVFEAMTDFALIYFSAVDKRTPPDVRRKALKVRRGDTLFDNSDKAIRKSLEKIYPSLSRAVTAILRGEIDNPPPLHILAQRSKNFILIPNVLQEIVPIEDFSSSHQQYSFKIENVPYAMMKELRGQVACKGKARGRVRILKRKDQVSDIIQGEIIVSPMTTPDFLAAIQKAAAIVTDEGGVTCHAAIVARETGKPCIIGTKFATKILKDGDLVEVDADKGIIRIIKKS